MKPLILPLISLLLIVQAQAQHNYDASTIPAEMKTNAYSVVREERLEFEVKSISKAVYKVHKVVTVLNENGKDELVFREYVDQFRSLENVTIQTFDSKGNAIKKYKRNDLASQLVGEGLVPDVKIFYLEIPASGYPMTVMVDYEKRFSGLLSYPGYQVQVPEQSIEKSTCIVTVPANLDIRHKAKNTNLTPSITNDGQNKIYTWTVNNQTPFETEEGSLGTKGFPHILIAPNKFEMGGYVGDMSTWENLARWNGSLIRKSNNLSEDRKLFFKDLVKNAKTEREKISIIYHYLQSNFRYVSIQLGMGGLIPFEADFVDKKKYGDCKALSNYTMACLSAVGIRSHYAWINSSYNGEPVDLDFPHDDFNHAILCVPQQKDTIWLECTSTTADFAVLGPSTENRNALLVTEEGGKLVPTPKSKAVDNLFASSTTVNLLEDGSGTAKIALSSKGKYKQVGLFFTTLKRDDQKYFLINYFDFMTPDEFEIKYDSSDRQQPIFLDLRLGKVPEFTAGKKSFLNPRLYKIWSNPLPKSNHRKQDFYFQHPFIKTDTTVYQLADGYAIETLPKAKKISFEYGSFNTNYEFDEAKKQVISTARLQLNEYKIPAAKFAATKDFFNQVLEEYTEKIVIRRL